MFELLEILVVIFSNNQIENEIRYNVIGHGGHEGLVHPIWQMIIAVVVEVVDGREDCAQLPYHIVTTTNQACDLPSSRRGQSVKVPGFGSAFKYFALVGGKADKENLLLSVQLTGAQVNLGNMFVAIELQRL